MEKLGFPVLRENFRPDKGDWKLDLKFGDGELEIFAIPGAPLRPGVGVKLGNFHHRLVLPLGPLEHLVLTGVGIGAEVAHIGDVHNPVHVIPIVPQEFLTSE